MQCCLRTPPVLILTSLCYTAADLPNKANKHVMTSLFLFYPAILKSFSQKGATIRTA